MIRFALAAPLVMLPALANAIETPLYIQLGETLTTVESELEDQGNGQYQAVIELEKGSYPLWLADRQLNCPTRFGPAEATRLKLNRPQALDNCADAPFQFKVLMSGRYAFVLDNSDPATPQLTVTFLKSERRQKRAPPPVSCIDWDGGPVTVEVADVFAEGEQVRDFYSGQLATVAEGRVTLQPAPGSGGLLLLEAADHQPSAFSWDNATVYFIMTDRFFNGDPGNDMPLGRQKDGKQEIGTFHGGDLQGVLAKLDYLEQLGIDAIWLTPLVEQIHGFVGGGKGGDFPFYGYHGYWAKDFTRLDPNFGSEADLKQLVDQAHQRGIRVLLDVVINHVGYVNLADMQQAGITAIRDDAELPTRWSDWQPGPGQSWHDWSAVVDWDSPQWAQKWWGPDWVRSGLPGYDQPDKANLTMALSGLPDFKTESPKAVALPPLLQRKTDTRAESTPETTVIDYLVQWQSGWVRDFGIDGFRADTVKHVELASWQKLKTAASDALAQWKAAHPDQALDDLPFWMVGEVWGHAVYRDDHFDHGFDSLVNFEFQSDFARKSAQCLPLAEPAYTRYAKAINTDPGFSAMSYISSHDTKLFFGDFEDFDLQRNVAAAFLLLPGQVQIYYGDETGRPIGPYGDDFHQGTRSDMNWAAIQGERADLLAHWQKLIQFRRRHQAIGGGAHQKLSDNPYVFSRRSDGDRVLVVFAGRRSGD